MIEILTNFDDTPLEKIETLEFDIKNYNQYYPGKKHQVKRKFFSEFG